ncbi:hypothetical protein RMR21_025690 (plasmid) [Agrobacterium sp. rho-8.1]
MTIYEVTLTVESSVIHIDLQPGLTDLTLRLPAPFVVSQRERSPTWQMSVSKLDLAERWPDKSRVIGMYRPGGIEPFPWFIEEIGSDSSLVWLLDENTGDRARMFISQKDMAICLQIERADSKWISRVIKQILSSRLLLDGWIPLHASAVSYGDKTLVWAGHRGSGKSTLAFLAASLKGAKFLADDIVFVRQLGPQWDVIGWPGRVAVRRALLQEVFGLERVAKFEPELRRGIASDRTHPRGERLAFDPDEVQKYLEIAYCGHSTGRLRIANIRPVPACFQHVNSRLGDLRSEFEATGFDRRYLVDPFRLFSIPEITSPIVEGKAEALEIEELDVPYNALSAFEDLWAFMLRGE